MARKAMNRESQRTYHDKEQRASMKISFNESNVKTVNDVFIDVNMKGTFGCDDQNAYLVLKPYQVEDLIKQLTNMINYPSKAQAPEDISGEGFIS